MTVNSQRLLLAAAGAAAAGEGLYVDDVFSTYLYTGNDGTQTITNGIDLDGEGGMVWVKTRNSGYTTSFMDHAIVDTVRGDRILSSNSTADDTTWGTPSGFFPSFNSNGFTVGSGSALANHSSRNYASWTFRKAPGFFDVVTYTGTGANRSIAHSLGSVPGCILIKCTSRNGDDWIVYHRSLGNTKFLNLNQTYGASTDAAAWNSSTPTSTVFYLGDKGQVNDLNQSYVAYIFAHDDQSFGEDEDEAIIKCGSYNGGTAGQEISVGFEPQWLLVKRSNGTRSWIVVDSMRPVCQTLSPDSSIAEVDDDGNWEPTANGFRLPIIQNDFNGTGMDYVYVAIRRPHKPPEAGTDVFHTASGTFTTTPITTGFPLDFGLYAYKASDTYKFAAHDRLRGLSSNSTQKRYGLITSSTAAENPTLGTSTQNVTNTSYDPPPYFAYNDSVLYSFRRAPGFFDMVAYTGTGSAQNVNHNLEVTPELMIVKSRSAGNWNVYSSATGATKYLNLNKTDAVLTATSRWNDTAPTSSVFTAGTTTSISSENFIAYLFATLPGISKVGSYTGTGSNIGVDCGFTAGARFVLIKRTDSTGDWYVYDSTRGIVGGNDPYLLINSTAAEVTNTDYIDPLNSGFTVTSSAPAALNASGGTYIFLAIA